MNTMKRIIIIAMVALVSGGAMGYGEVYPANNDVRDTESLQRGAQLYFENCVGCHSLEYARYNRVARDLKIPEDLFERYLLDADRPIGDLMTNALSPALGSQFFGTEPPDLTLVARVRGTDWIYTLLTGFYKDDSRPYGVNNALYNNIGMPHAMVNQQGLCAEAPGADGCQEFAFEGSMSPDEFDLAMVDLTNFLDYMGEPIQLERQRIGWFVMAFLSVFLVFAWLLYRELWKDVK
ncbi:MAG: cytochrome c1 [Natronospirillum sp.]|uniref:cytochrome c1 n=1 Tax=Natronospirillum sp. TaxID=2812955 RepID=UPI0025EC20FC|nr:cytochrome c1 [Natronospirillum sp.]MCH8550588.1 cytochrome c1 [Natronospirillum sp.]